MISFGLVCENDHEFEGWFSSSGEFSKQRRRTLVECPTCGSTKIEKALMAPSVSTSRRKEKLAVASIDKTRKAVMAEMKQLRDKIVDNSEDVGDRFPEEARKIHYGESEARGIIGEANSEEVESLLEEGVEIAPLPVLPDDAN